MTQTIVVRLWLLYTIIEIEPGERVAQLVITPYLTAVFEETEELSDTVRGEGGFGSTGRK